MAHVVCFCLALFALTGLVRVDGHMKRYKPLISKVHKYYGTSSVFFVYGRNHRQLEGFTLAHSLCRDFSRNHVLTLVVDFDQMDERINWYEKQIGRPLIVILLQSVSDIVEFNENIQYMNISYPIWLIIFIGTTEKVLCEYCEFPRGNIFGLRFDTEMLVHCCDKPMLKEWWSISGDSTEMADFATWSKHQKLKVVAIEGLYARRHNVKGVGLRLGLVTTSTLIYEVGNGFTGLVGDVLMELQRNMNFTITKIVPSESYGIWNPKTKSWNGIFGQLNRGEIDLGAADFTISSSRKTIADFTFPLALTKSQLYIRDPDGTNVEWFAHFQTFSYEVWIAIILLILAASILLSLIKVNGGSRSWLSLIIEDYLYIWGIFCQQGLCEFPVTSSLRIAYFSIFFLALVISAAYSATLVSFLTVSTSSMPFTSLQGFVDDGTYQLTVNPNNSEYAFLTTSNDPIIMKMKALIKPIENLAIELQNGWDQACEEKVAMYANDVMRKTSNINIKCRLAAIDTGHVETLGMVTPAGSQFSNVMNYHIKRFRDAGVIHRLTIKHFTESTVVKPKYVVVDFWGVASPLTILSGGVVLASTLLICEKIYFSLKKYLCSRKRCKNS